MQYGFCCVSRVVVILPPVIVVFNCITLAFNAVKTCEHVHSCRVRTALFMILVPSRPSLFQSLIYWTWSAMNGYHSTSCGKQSFSLSKWRISLSAKGLMLGCSGYVGGVQPFFPHKSLLTQLTRQTDWDDKRTQHMSNKNELCRVSKRNETKRKIPRSRMKSVIWNANNSRAQSKLMIVCDILVSLALC